MKKYKKQFGGSITDEDKERYAESKHWNGGKFHNLVETTMDVNLLTIPKLLYKQICSGEAREPSKDIPVARFDTQSFTSDNGSANIIWYGHSVVLVRLDGQNILIDPMFGPNASPIAPFATNRFTKNTLDVIDDLPEIDLVLFTHDHYDHLDMASMLKLKTKVRRYGVALGVARHLLAWGIDGDDIREFDWWDSLGFNGLQVTFTPTRHFSGRGLNDRAKSLWGGWVLQGASEKLYFSGDGGYGQHFREVGSRLGPFDFGFMECGQYNEHWHQIHMYPEESVQAAIDSGVRKAMPVHWSGFALAHHSWTEPVERFVESAEKNHLDVCVPRIGEQFQYPNANVARWWEDFS